MKKQIKELAYLPIVIILFFLLFIPVIYFVENSVEKKVEMLYSNSVVKNSLIKSEVVKLEDFITEEFSLLILFYVLLISLVYSIFLIITKKIKQDLLNRYDKLIKELRYKHYYDNLTDLPNRNKLIEDLDKYNGLILMDIDDFSDINDVFGYKFGNKLLQELVLELRKDFLNLYRAGNDEFVIAYDRKINKNDLCKIYEREFVFEDIKITFTVSGSNQKGLLLKTAESALKIAKKNNFNCLLFDKSMEENQIKRVRTIQKLKKVLEEEKIIPFYQCIIGKENKYEALMRVEIDGKILTPFAFMDLLKESKLYAKFSQIMIKKVFEDLKKGRIENVSINISFADIIDEDTRKYIFGLIKNCKKNYLITFEILESESIKNVDIVKEFIFKVKDRGIKIAIDDFGSGYSNFIRILELNPDFIKIDGSLIKNLNNNRYFEIVKLIVEFAKKFNIKTVAEFVENEEIYNILKTLGVDYFQGYYFCKPERLENIEKLS